MPLAMNYGSAELPPYLRDAFIRLSQEIEALGKEKPHIYGTLSAQERAEMTPEQAQAALEGERELANLPPEFRQMFERVQAGSNWQTPLTNADLQTRRGNDDFPKFSEDYMNPYMENVTKPMAEIATRNFKENILPQLSDIFASQGMHGSERYQRMVERATRDLNEGIAREIGKAQAAGYGQAGEQFSADRNRALQSAAQYGDIATKRSALNAIDLGNLERSGRIQQQHAQSALDINKQRFLRQQEYPWENVARQNALISGMPLQARNMNVYQTPAQPELNTAGQLGALGFNLLGARMAGGGAGSGYQGFNEGGPVSRLYERRYARASRD